MNNSGESNKAPMDAQQKKPNIVDSIQIEYDEIVKEIKSYMSKFKSYEEGNKDIIEIDTAVHNMLQEIDKNINESNMLLRPLVRSSCNQILKNLRDGLKTPSLETAKNFLTIANEFIDNYHPSGVFLSSAVACFAALSFVAGVFLCGTPLAPLGAVVVATACFLFLLARTIYQAHQRHKTKYKSNNEVIKTILDDFRSSNLYDKNNIIFKARAHAAPKDVNSDSKENKTEPASHNNNNNN
jgi:hypothetical protein